LHTILSCGNLAARQDYSKLSVAHCQQQASITTVFPQSVSSTLNFVINLEYKPNIPLYKRLSDALKNAIREGRLEPGEAMPSTRDLSETLKISRATVLRAIDDLVDQGYINAKAGSGLFVSDELPVGDQLHDNSQTVSSAARSVKFSKYAQRVQRQQKELKTNWLERLPEIDHGGPPLDLTPIKEWERLTKLHCRATDISELTDTIQPFGYPPLQEAVAAYLHRSRAVKCTANQVAVFSSKQLRFELVVRLLIDAGDHVAIEEPGYPEARYMLKAHGAEIHCIPVDNEGMMVDKLIELNQQIKFVYVTPSRQDPTGAVLSIERRRQLLEWAQRTGTYLIEDDYDCEYRYARKALPSMQAIDGGDCVIYLASFWKVLFPLVNFGIVVFPKRLLSVAEKAKMETERYLPVVEQVVLTDLINEGHLERCIRRTQSKLAVKRQALNQALFKHLKERLTILEEGGGTHQIVRFKGRADAEQILACSKKCGLPIISTAAYYVSQSQKNEFMLTFADIDDQTIEATVERWAAMIEETSLA